MTPRLSRRITVTALALGAGLALLSGCAPSGSATSPAAAPIAIRPAPTAEQILRDAQQAMLTSDSVHVKGLTPEFGEYDLQTNPRSQMATLTLGSEPGTIVKVHMIGGYYYISGNDAYWQMLKGPKGADLMRNKFIKVPVYDAKYWGDLQATFKLGQFTEHVANVTSKPIAKVNGVSLLPLHINMALTLYIEVTPGSTDSDLTTGRPVRLESLTGQTKLDYTYPPTAYTIAVPSADKLVDFRSLDEIPFSAGC